ncbi:MAG: nucleotidyl transferase AbiEii/AbiGii toxin family protein [Candidatus Aenigmarchaeota archaeon]|nr:nucleotidyl transferase AbiEii/AbiGii toxin family protein [Candidatus Aenigmarchaeota archaeon]
MISRKELQEYAKTVGLNLGQAEKDYFQNILLFLIYRNYGKDIVFKGGTALKKCYGIARFSEDLDFTCLSEMKIEKIEDGLRRFNLEFETETKKYPVGLKVTFRIKGPLYNGIRFSLCKLIMDFSFRENVILNPNIKTIGRFLEEIPTFDVFVMQEPEILAEKVRAILTRTTARDVYDIWFLLNNGVKFDQNLVKKKLEYYNQKWNPREFSRKLGMKSSIWKTELESLIPNVPDFREARKLILENVPGKPARSKNKSPDQPHQQALHLKS